MSNKNLWSMLDGSTLGKKYTLNFDGSHNNQANKSGAGCIIRDSQGEFVVAASYSLTETYPEYSNVAIVEAVALLNGLKLAKDRNLNLNLIRGDSTEVIHQVLDLSRRPSRPPLSEIIQQIVGMIDLFSQKIEIIDRGANQVADKLASLGCNKLHPGARKLYITYFDLPPEVTELIRQEKSLNMKTEEKYNHGEEGSSSSSISSLVEDIGKAGAAVAGVAMLAWGMYKLVSGETSSDASKTPFNNDYYTLHYSGNDINQHQIGGAGCIIRNKQGKLVIAATYNLNHLYPHQYNIAVAEAIAWSKGLKLAKTKSLKLDRVVGDNNEVINRVLGLEKKAPGVPLLSEIVGDIRVALQEHCIDPITQVEHIGRDDNKVANELASLGSRLGGNFMERSYGIDDVLPSKLAQLIREDEINYNFRGKNLLM